jgi:hypothetical protein
VRTRLYTLRGAFARDRDGPCVSLADGVPVTTIPASIKGSRDNTGDQRRNMTSTIVPDIELKLATLTKTGTSWVPLQSRSTSF